jgi:hypothetical protein
MVARSLSAFHPLSRAEEALVAGLDSGTFDRVGDGGLPEEGDETRRVRAELVRFLLLGGPEAPRLHETGLRIGGGWVTGRLDLEGCRIERDIGLADCRFEFAPVLRSAVIDSLVLDGSALPGVIADRLEARGDVYLRAAQVEGAVKLRGARIDGEAVFDGAQVAAPEELAIDAERLEVRGGVLLRGTRLRGAVSLLGARLGGELDAIGAAIERPGGVALEATGLDCRGDVSLRRAVVAGEIALTGARLGADVDLRGGSFEQPGGDAITLRRTTIAGALILRDGARVTGALSLNGATVGTLVDDPASWPGPGDLLLNHCRYGGFLASPIDAETRLDWLSRQDSSRWGEDFWPQPYEQLSHVLGAMGHDEDARRVLIAKERLQRAARRSRAGNAFLRWFLWLRDILVGITVGYGRQPFYAFGWLLLFWAVGAAMFAMVEYFEALRPNVPVVLRSPEWVLCRSPAGEELFLPSTGQLREGLAEEGQSQFRCYLGQPEAFSYPRFNAWMYSLDTLVPFLETGQQDFWIPDVRQDWGLAGRIYLYVQTIAGYALSLLAVAGFSGIVKSK